MFTQLFQSEPYLLRYRSSVSFPVSPWVEIPATHVRYGVLSTWTRCPPQVGNRNTKETKNRGYIP